jgi:hypothetical protein
LFFMSSQPVPSPRDTAPAGVAPDPALAAGEALSFDYAGHAWLREVRWRRPPYDRRGIAVALFVALILHLVGLWLVRDWMRLHLPEEDRSDVIRVSLVEPPVPAPLSPPEPVEDEPPPAVEAPRPVPRAASRPSQPSAAAPVVSATPAQQGVPQVHLYNADGSLDVSTLAKEPESGPFYEFRAPTFVQAPMMKHTSPLPYTPTKFEEYWPSDNETIVDEFFRRSTKTATMRTPWGGGITCSWMIIIGGCGFGYAPPNPEGLKKMRVNPPMKKVPKEAEKKDEPAPVLDLKLQEAVPAGDGGN